MIVQLFHYTRPPSRQALKLQNVRMLKYSLAVKTLFEIATTYYDTTQARVVNSEEQADSSLC